MNYPKKTLCMKQTQKRDILFLNDKSWFSAIFMKVYCFEGEWEDNPGDLLFPEGCVISVMRKKYSKHG